MRKLGWLERLVQKTTQGSIDVGRRLVRDWVIGVYVAGTTILSGVARALRPDKLGFEAALERLSRGLRRQGRAVRETTGRYRRRAAEAMRRHGLDVVAIDLSEIVKPYGRKMPFLCEVRDGSKSTRQKTVIEQGWWTVEVVATTWTHIVVPLVRQVYSTVHPMFVSVQQELRRALQQVQPLLPPGVRAVLDRGFDGETYFGVLDEFFSLWCVRQRGDRQVYLPGTDEPVRMSTLARAVRKDQVARPTKVRDGALERVEIRFGYLTVEVPREASRRTRRKPACRRMTLIAVEHDDPIASPMMLLCSRPVRAASEARRWVEDYHRRWSAEDETRGAKQLGGLEDLRVQSWESLQNLVALSVLVPGLLALLQLEAPRRAARLARLAPIDGDVPPYALYRIWMTVALLLGARRVSA